MKFKAFLGAAAILVAGTGALWFLCGGGCTDRTVAEPYRERDLTVEEIRARLQSGDFKQRLEASRQIDKLEPDEKRRVLLVLADDPDAATRLLAVKKLRTIDHPQVREKLGRIAKEDPDVDVRQLAAEKL